MYCDTKGGPRVAPERTVTSEYIAPMTCRSKRLARVLKQRPLGTIGQREKQMAPEVRKHSPGPLVLHAPAPCARQHITSNLTNPVQRIRIMSRRLPWYSMGCAAGTVSTRILRLPPISSAASGWQAAIKPEMFICCLGVRSGSKRSASDDKTGHWEDGRISAECGVLPKEIEHGHLRW